jgi:ligand-binding sensor domain-containing protein/signal transduction histidine kinase/DNA-binding response OmpR family regulator
LIGDKRLKTMNVKIARVVLCMQLAISFTGHLCFSQPANKGLIQNNSLNETGIIIYDINNEPVFQSLSPDFEYNAVRCIFKDFKGFMWFGTESGLVLYDGVSLYIYENITGSATSLNNNAINAIAEDKNKNLWIGTSGGLNLYNREKDNFSGVPNINGTINDLNQILISALCTDNKSILWVGSYMDGLYAYDYENEKTRNYSHNANDHRSISSDRITCMIMDKEGNLWIGTQNGLNFFTSAEGFKRFFNEPANIYSLSNNYITSLTLDRNGCIWAGTKGGGLNRVVKGRDGLYFERYTTDTRGGRISNNYILSLFADKRGNIWIGTDNGGLNRLNTLTGLINYFKTEAGNEYGINSNSIWSLFGDEEDRLWIGTYNKGINVIDEKFRKFESFQKIRTAEKSLNNNDVMGFAEDNRGNIWIATNGGGICRFDPGNRQFNRLVFNNNNNAYLSNNAVQDILYDSNDNLWIGTWSGGIDRLNRDGIIIRSYRLINNIGAENNNVFTLYQDPRGNIWAGTAGNGLFLYDKKADEFFSFTCGIEPDLISNLSYVTALLTDAEHNLWIGTLYGLVILKKQNNQLYQCVNFLHSDNPSSLSSNVVECIFEDHKGRLWIGTSDKGLNLFSKQDSSFTVFQKKDGLPANSIKGMLEDDEGFLWISTSMGICRFNYEKNNFRNYSKEDGLNSNEFNLRSCLRTRKGEFYFGSENGFNFFYPAKITENTFISAVYLTELRINNKPAVIGADDSPLKKHISETTEITLNYKQTSFSIDFVALNYTRPLRNQFCFKLEGFDKDWNCIGTQRTANYTNILPGKYVFMVKGSNNDGIWNDLPAKLMITVKPPFWKTWWALTIYILLFSLLVFFSFRIWNERIAIKHQLKFEQLGREKEHELNELNIQFFTNISHEFRTPLSLIIAPLESLISSAKGNINEQLMVIYRNAGRLLQLTNNLMDIRKLEEGRIKLKVQYGDLLGFIHEVSSFFNVNSGNRNINFAIETSEVSLPGWFDHEKLETILLNLLSNAFKYTQDHGKIRIIVNVINAEEIKIRIGEHIGKIKSDSRYIEVTVADNGTGILPEELPYIFDKFYQAKFTGMKKKSGTGIGLALTKGLIEMHYGTIRAESIPDIETRFTFILPIDRIAYGEDEILTEPASLLERIILADDEHGIYPNENKDTAEKDKNEEKPEILIVEDNEELRAFLVKELGMKFNVAQAGDGKSGIVLAQSEIPDLIVSDILMPRTSGIELCKTIKSDIRTCHIPVILLTAKTSINEQIEGIETGADVYITKPFNIQFLCAQINQLIRSRRELYAYFSKEVYMMPNKLAENELDNIFLKEAIDYIILNITDNSLSVEGLADHLKLSRSNVYRKIKALTGQSIIEFISLIRLKQAIKLMETNIYTLAEIAYQTGFTSPSYFTKCFKKQYGKPPSEFLVK